MPLASPRDPPMRLTKQTSHAIRILMHCARAGGQLAKVAEIAEDLDLTQQNVFKIVHLLRRAGFLEAVRGRYGGVRLKRDPAAIRIGDVVRATEVTNVAIEGESVPSRRGRRQPISRVLDDALEAFISVLDQHTLEEMARAPRGGAASERVASPPARQQRGPKAQTSAAGVRQGTGTRR